MKKAALEKRSGLLQLDLVTILPLPHPLTHFRKGRGDFGRKIGTHRFHPPCRQFLQHLPCQQFQLGHYRRRQLQRHLYRLRLYAP